MPLVSSVVIDFTISKRLACSNIAQISVPKEKLDTSPILPFIQKDATKNRNASVTTMPLPVAMPHLFPMMPRQLRNIPHPIEGVAPAHGNKVPRSIKVELKL